MFRGNYRVLWSKALDGADAVRYEMDDVTHEGQERVGGGSWYWSVPTLLDELGWESIAQAQEAADRWAHLEDTIAEMEVADDMDAADLDEAESRIEAQMAAAGGPLHTARIDVTVFHAPTQRILPLVSASYAYAMSSFTLERELRFGEQNLFTTNYSVTVALDTLAGDCRLSLYFMEDDETCDGARAMFALQSAVEGWK
jgi:hypothetical protein